MYYMNLLDNEDVAYLYNTNDNIGYSVRCLKD